jgi:hypothetical protein
LVLNTDMSRTDLLIGYEPMIDKSDEACASKTYEILADLNVENMKHKLGVITDAGQGKTLLNY